MVIYSILTFGAGPYIVRLINKSPSKDQDCVPGFIRFYVSIFCGTNMVHN